MNYNLCLITDPFLAKGLLNSIVALAIKGGVTIVQYRNKNATTKVMVEEAFQLRKITKAKNVSLIINDRVDVALAINADGVHLGQSDMPLVVARKLLGPKKIIGVSVKTIGQAKKAVEDGADYLGVGSVFRTQTKKDAGEPLGLQTLKKIIMAVKVPVIGIGGITKENAHEVIAAGAKGVAVVSAIMGKKNPEKEARELLQVINSS